MIKRLPWLRMLKKTDPEPPLRLPIAAGSITNGEGWWPDTRRKKLLRKMVIDHATEVSRKHGIDRREFMASSCGMATTLFMINVLNGCGGGGKSGPRSSTSSSKTDPMAKGMGDAGMMKKVSYDFEPTYNIPEAACYDPDVADQVMGGNNELVIDMQSHFATPETNPVGAMALSAFIGSITPERFPWLVRTPGVVDSGRYDRAEYINQILMGSPTTIGVLSGISYGVGEDGTNARGFAVLTNEDLLGGADYLNEQYPGRILKHCMVMPNDRIEVQLEMMERNADSYHNWKTYPPFQANGSGYWLHEDVGPMMIQKGLDLGLPIFCVHKGFPLSGFSAEHCSPKDIGPAARMFPDARIVVYHSGFENGMAAGESSHPGVTWTGEVCGDNQNELTGAGMWPEGPYDEQDEEVQMLYPLDRGVNSLIKSLRDNNIGPNGRDLDDPNGPVRTHVYAESGGVWPALMTGRRDEAMHYWGKLLKHVGEDRIVWGTDCLWFGSPAPLIQAFRCFEITKDFQDKYGYPELTQKIKEKILGQNAARLQSIHPDVDIKGSCHSDYLGAAQIKLQRELDEEFGPRRDMMYDVWGPKTRREFFSLVKHETHEKQLWSGNVPAVRPTRKKA